MNSVISPVNIEERAKLGVKSGDTVRVWQKLQEGDKTRLQAFEGLVIAQKHGKEAGATFTVRKVSGGVGVEKIFPLYSPMIDKIEITKRAKVRRSKLYHIREKAAKEIRRQMRNMRLVDISTASDLEEKTKAEKVEAEETKEKTEEPKTETKSQEEESKPARTTDDVQSGGEDASAIEESKEEKKEEEKEEKSE